MKNAPGKKFVAYLILSVGVLMTMGYASAQQGHPWSEIILPVGTTWVGLDADMVDGYHWSDVTALLLWGSSGANVFNLNSGNVGIGTNSPSQQLDVDGSLRVRGLAGCDTIDTDGDGNLACGTDNDGVGLCSECDGSFVNEGQANSITSSMVVDGAVANADLANGAVSNAKLANNAVTSSKIQDGTIGSADINSGQVQRRVTGGCSGQVVVDVNQDGSLVCEPDNVGSSGISCSDCDGRFINVGETGDSIADNTIDNTEIQDGTIGSNDINSGQVQERVDSVCPAGSSIRAISSTGGVTCETDSTGSNGCNWVGWKYSAYVTTADGIVCNSGNAICRWQVRTGLYCSSNTITDVRMESQRIATGFT